MIIDTVTQVISLSFYFLLVVLLALVLVGFILRSLACLARSGVSTDERGGEGAEEGGGAEGSLEELVTPSPDNTVSVRLRAVSLLMW